MPQLDKFAFAPQVFWLVLVFFVVYLLVLKNGLAVLYRVLSFRKKSIQLLNLDVARFVVEATFLTKFLLSFLSSRAVADSVFKLSELFLTKSTAKQAGLRTLRVEFASRSLNLKFVGAKQGLIPLVKRYSIVKLV
jgi:hypothetical protein